MLSDLTLKTQLRFALGAAFSANTVFNVLALQYSAKNLPGPGVSRKIDGLVTVANNLVELILNTIRDQYPLWKRSDQAGLWVSLYGFTGDLVSNDRIFQHDPIRFSRDFKPKGAPIESEHIQLGKIISDLFLFYTQIEKSYSKTSPTVSKKSGECCRILNIIYSRLIYFFSKNNPDFIQFYPDLDPNREYAEAICCLMSQHC